MRRLFWLPFCAVLAACPPPIDTGADGGGPITVGPEGGLFIRDGVAINIPKDAVASETIITVTVIDQDCTSQISTLTCVPKVPERARISMGYRFSPASLQFREPVTIAVPYLEDRLPAKGIDKATFDMRRADGDDPYLELPSPSTLGDQPIVQAKSEKLGLFWVTSPEKPAVSELTLSPQEATLMVGGTQQFSAQVTDPAGNPVPEVEITWSIVPARVAKVDATGLVEALAPGTATLTASAGDAQQQATVFVIGDAVGPTTFVHENPFPTGNDLHGGAVSNGFSFFVGSNATVLSRSPQNQWTRLFSNPGFTLKAAAGALPTSGVAVGISGQAGVLVEVNDGQTPALKVFQTVQPQAVWFDGTHGMAVGYGNDVIVRRDGAWVSAYSPSFETLMDVVGDGQGGFITVGDRGSLYIFDPVTQTWDSLFNTQLNVLFVDAVIANATGSEAWGVGANKLWHFEQNGWTAVNLPSTTEVDALTAVGIVDGLVVVGARKGRQGHILVYTPPASGGADGGTPAEGTWTSVPLRGQQIIRGVFGQGQDGYAVGDFGAVWQYAGGTFTELSSGFYGDVMDVFAAPGVAVAAVNECQDAACTARVGKVVSRDQNGAWQELGFQAFSGPLFAVAARSASEVWAAGEGSIWRFDGQSWTPSFLSSLPIRDIAVCGEDVYAVGEGGVVLKGTSALTMQPALGSNDLHAVSCQSGSEVWIAGDGVLFRNRTFVKDPQVNHALWRSVWTPAANEAYVFGDARFGVYWNTQNMRVYQQPGGLLPEVIPSLWGSSVDNLYAVAWTVNPFNFAYAVRFNGAQWTLVDAGASRRPNSVHGSSATDVYIGTEGGGILRGVLPQ